MGGTCGRGSLSVKFTQLEDQKIQDRALMSPTVPYPPNSPTSCPCWSDVTGQLEMSRPHPQLPSVCPLSPLSQCGFNHWCPTVTQDSQWSTYQTQTKRQLCGHTTYSYVFLIKPIALYKLFIVLCNSFFLHTLYIKGKKSVGGGVYKEHKKKTLLGSSDLTTS